MTDNFSFSFFLWGSFCLRISVEYKYSCAGIFLRKDLQWAPMVFLIITNFLIFEWLGDEWRAIISCCSLSYFLKSNILLWVYARILWFVFLNKVVREKLSWTNSNGSNFHFWARKSVPSSKVEEKQKYFVNFV